MAYKGGVVDSPLVFGCSGCFIRFHEGHRDLLQTIKKLSNSGDCIYIGINTDDYVQKKKGSIIEGEEERLLKVKEEANSILTGRVVSVCISDSVMDKIKSLHEGEKIIWAVGSDYSNLDFKEATQASVVVVTPRIGISTSKILEGETKDKPIQPSLVEEEIYAI